MLIGFELPRVTGEVRRRRFIQKSIDVTRAMLLILSFCFLLVGVPFLGFFIFYAMLGKILEDSWILVLWFGITVFLFAVGYFSARRKRILLFLRRFGNDEINIALRRAMRQNLRRSYRLVTLADDSFRPVPVSWFQRLWPLALSLVAIIVTIPFSIGVVYLWQVSDAGFGGFYEGLVGGAMMLAMIFVVVTFLILGIMTAVIGWRVSRKSHLAISSEKELDKAIHYAKTLKSRVHAMGVSSPIASMISVIDRLWRPSVMRLAATANVVVIDVTHPTESIEWEVAHIVGQDIPILILAQREKFVSWTNVADDHSLSKWSALLKKIRGLPLVTHPSAKQLSSRQLLDAVDFVRFARTNHRHSVK